MSTEAEAGPARPRVFKRCPYCREVFPSFSLYEHVRSAEDEAHGPRGETPEGFSVSDIEPVSVSESADLKLACKWCGTVVEDMDELREHVESSAGEDRHPQNPRPENAAIRVPPGSLKNSGERPFSEHVERMLRGYQSAEAGTGKPTSGGEPAVPVSELEELLNELRENEGKAGGWYKSAQMLDDLLSKYR